MCVALGGRWAGLTIGLTIGLVASFTAFTAFSAASALAGFRAALSVTFPAHFAWCLAIPLRLHVLRSQASVTVAIELAERLAGVRHFVGVDGAVVIGVEDAEEQWHPTFRLVLALPFALRWSGRAVGLVLLRVERPGGERERRDSGQSR